MNRIILALALLLAPIAAFSQQQIITATVTVTNTAGTTNGETITVNGTTRTITNAITSTQILYGTNIVNAVSNLFTAYAQYPQSGMILANPATNQVSYQSYPGQAMTVTVSTNWATVSYSTNTITQAIVVRIPYTVEGAYQQTNVASGLVAAIDSQQNTNSIHESSIVATNLVGMTNAQTVAGAKSFTNALGNWNGSINSASINGTIGSVTNGGFLNPTTTNLINYGNPIGSPGSGGSSSFQAGNGANSSGTFSTTVGASSKATASFASAFGYQAAATNVGAIAIGLSPIAGGYAAIAIGGGAQAMETNTVAIGRLSNVSSGHTNSMAIGYQAATTAANQLMIGSPSISVAVNASLTVGGGATFANGITNLTTTGTNNFPAGSDIAFGWYALTSLANGNNAAVPVGTNTAVQVSGPTGAFTINGINGQPNRDGKILTIMNNTGQSMTFANESGTDPTAGNRILTGLSADETFTNKPGVVNLQYHAVLGRWIIISHN